MRYEYRELIDILQDLRRDAVACMKVFIKPNGAVLHHPNAPSEAQKTTLRTAQFFIDFPAEAIKAEQYALVKSYAAKSMSRTVLSIKDGALYDKEWALMIHPFSSKRSEPYEDFVNCAQYIESLDYLRETGAVDLNWSNKQEPMAWPHTTYFYLFDRIIGRFDRADRRPPGFNWNRFHLRVCNRCAEELHKQCSVFGADAMGHFDAAKLAFALAPALSVTPPEVVDNALKICADRLADAPNQAFSPFHVVDRDRYFRPLLEEITSALLDGALRLLERRRTALNSIDSIARLARVVAERALLRRKKTSDASGWTAIDGPYPPEAWPTLAVAEFAASAEAFFRRSTLFHLCNQYQIRVRLPDRAMIDWSKYNSLPFGVHANITTNMLKDGGDWRSVVLFGPPGTGKTSMVHAIAKERGWDLVIITPVDVAQDGPDRIIARARELLEGLSYVEGVVVFLDEFEPFVRLRAKKEEEMWWTIITNSMLPLLQELRDSSRIYCFLATNFITKIDYAATREGRFDAILPVWPPDKAGRLKLIKQYTGRALSRDELEKAATATKGCTKKELQAMCKSRDRNWRPGSLTDDLSEYASELQRARPPVDAGKFT